MKYLVKSAIKGPKGPVKPGEIVELDQKLGDALVLAGAVEALVSSKPEESPVEAAPEVVQPKKKKGK